ncbi:ATP-grasp enzyme, D-alanine-D-alanine ligase [Desulfocapsa sulfexigens DSM 10523]|uniref:ATP-grasp enzyme, D-alanine-D-alanine ligase n=1 Tax=Desulfocapsa sulfexigens (strain DSM 10523 / SB164P1) TaxID=1167006 RepID=M1NA13_DESSD|nr:ATP-grasp enzyme, D-alanine-D-alanine ligase [Desulfocapsa sulfexigens]AGF76694.1 ATP-grasp enzyme, D-alanine-D-alanine ligase [Desulfocapsa sulfexigens DSM 10523]
MKIGLTFDLRSAYLEMGFSELETAEFDRDDTITAIENALTTLGHKCERIGHARQLMQALTEGKRWDLVFNIAEGMYGIGREAQIPAILDVFNIPYTFSDPLVMSLTLHKGMTKRVLRDAKVAVSDFLVAEKGSEAAAISFGGPWFIKPVAEGTGKGIDPTSIVRDKAELPGAVDHLIEKFKQPVIIEPYLPGREFTVGIVGTGNVAKVLGTIEVVLLQNAEEGVYSYVNKEECEERVEYRLVHGSKDPVVKEAENTALEAWRVLGCRDGGRADLRCNANGKPLFMEVNPLAGIHPQHSDLPILCTMQNIDYLSLVEMILTSASARVTL